MKGTSILVAAPENEVDKLRLEIAGEGLVRSARIGHDIIDKNQFGRTNIADQGNLQHALEGELSQVISYLPEVFDARVHIVLPKDSFLDEKKAEPKARVIIALRKGAELSRSGIARITDTVVSAVPRLHRNNISIVDDEGRLLSQ